MKWLWSFALLLLISACKTPPPTKIIEQQPEPWTRLTEKTSKPLKLTEETVVLDSRSDFDYGLAHWSYSIHFTWKDLNDDPTKPWRLIDPHSAARKLGLLGIGPKTPVLVIGYSNNGSAEDGRLAWTLTYFGLEDVQTVSVNALDVYFTHQDSSPAKNVAPWNSTPKINLAIDRYDFLQAIAPPTKWHVIDVRSEKEYFDRTGDHYATADIHALQIEWKEFFSEDGRPNKAIKSKLKAIGVKPEDSIIVISNHGIRSSAAAYALTALGFHRVRNFLEGWDSLRKKAE
jgi:thiosulfate/3-mercaptopyruvate sulfurtransferase